MRLGASAGTIPAYLEATSEHLGDQLAVRDGGIELTYSQLAGYSREFAAALITSGIEAGDRVAIWLGNSAEWIVAALGLFQTGAVLIPISTRFKGGEASTILSRSRARVLVTATEFLGNDYVGMLRATETERPNLRTIVNARGPIADGALDWGEFLARATPDSRAAVTQRCHTMTPDDICDILFTSGTTGAPKGVVMTHSRTLVTALDWIAMTGLRAGDRYLMINPYFHMFGLKAGILACVAAGAVMLPEPVFDAANAIERIARERVTVLPAPPTVYLDVLDHPLRAQRDLSSLRIGLTAAADIPPSLVRRMRAELGLPTIVTGYGSTEGGTSTSTVASDSIETIATTAGRPRPGFEVRLVDHDGTVVSPGVPGEIQVRGGGVMSHYLDDPAATAAALSDDGWLSTGDIGTIGDDGNLRVVGRTKEMFIVGGFNAYPAEIESFLMQHPHVQRAAVVGVPDARLGEVGAAFVVLTAGATTGPDDIIAWSHQKMANFKVPRTVEILGELPVSATGKVLKTSLRDRALHARQRATADHGRSDPTSPMLE
jgi:HIP---CoA ligase